MPYRLCQTVAALLAGFILDASSLAATGVIVTLDSEKGEMTIAEGQRLETLRFRPGTEVTLNGRKASPRDLAVGQRVTTASGDPGVATKITATGLATSNAKVTTATGDPKADIVGTRWHVSGITGHPVEKQWVEFNGDGTTQAGWHKRRGSWRVLVDGRIEAEFSPQASKSFTITLDPDRQSGSYRHENGVTVIRRLSRR